MYTMIYYHLLPRATCRWCPNSCRRKILQIIGCAKDVRNFQQNTMESRKKCFHCIHCYPAWHCKEMGIREDQSFIQEAAHTMIATLKNHNSQLDRAENFADIIAWDTVPVLPTFIERITAKTKHKIACQVAMKILICLWRLEVEFSSRHSEGATRASMPIKGASSRFAGMWIVSGAKE